MSAFARIISVQIVCQMTLQRRGNFPLGSDFNSKVSVLNQYLDVVLVSLFHVSRGFTKVFRYQPVISDGVHVNSQVLLLCIEVIGVRRSFHAASRGFSIVNHLVPFLPSLIAAIAFFW